MTENHWGNWVYTLTSASILYPTPLDPETTPRQPSQPGLGLEPGMYREHDGRKSWVIKGQLYHPYIDA